MKIRRTSKGKVRVTMSEADLELLRLTLDRAVASVDFFPLTPNREVTDFADWMYDELTEFVAFGRESTPGWPPQ